MATGAPAEQDRGRQSFGGRPLASDLLGGVHLQHSPDDRSTGTVGNSPYSWKDVAIPAAPTRLETVSQQAMDAGDAQNHSGIGSHRICQRETTKGGWVRPAPSTCGTRRARWPSGKLGENFDVGSNSHRRSAGNDHRRLSAINARSGLTSPGCTVTVGSRQFPAIRSRGIIPLSARFGWLSVCNGSSSGGQSRMPGRREKEFEAVIVMMRASHL